MKFPIKRPLAGVAVVAFGMALSAAAFAEGTLATADQAFVAKVSQGGMFEVASSKVAAEKAQAQDVKDLASAEVHDHELVGAKLDSITSAAGVTLPTTLNADFQTRLDHLNSLSGKAFDDDYTTEMKRIHDIDGAAFATEAKTAKSAELKAFAAETVLIVHRHIGALHPNA